jgi:hypothetical protein
MVTPPDIGTPPKFERAIGAVVAPVPPFATVTGIVIAVAACSAVISFLAVRKLARTLAVVGEPATGTVGSILLVI